MRNFEHFAEISQAEQVERWTQCQRVLEALPEHERQHHWNMAKWGVKTACGTVCCAAGHCALDSWFNTQGFALIWGKSCECPSCRQENLSIGFPEVYESADLPNVGDFFGSVGAKRIFYKTEKRSVETVIEEVKAYIVEIQAKAA